MDNSNLSHTKWNCIYHIVFIPKYRRKAMYGEIRTGGPLLSSCSRNFPSVFQPDFNPNEQRSTDIPNKSAFEPVVVV